MEASENVAGDFTPFTPFSGFSAQALISRWFAVVRMHRHGRSWSLFSIAYRLSKLFRMSALRAGAGDENGADVTPSLSWWMRMVARKVGTSLEPLRPTSCLTRDAEKQKSMCGNAW
jgi:hypothetical protein